VQGERVSVEIDSSFIDLEGEFQKRFSSRCMPTFKGQLGRSGLQAKPRPSPIASPVVSIIIV
jgi:hypothetical protein